MEGVRAAITTPFVFKGCPRRSSACEDLGIASADLYGTGFPGYQFTCKERPSGSSHSALYRPRACQVSSVLCNFYGLEETNFRLQSAKDCAESVLSALCSESEGEGLGRAFAALADATRSVRSHSRGSRPMGSGKIDTDSGDFNHGVAPFDIKSQLGSKEWGGFA